MCNTSKWCLESLANNISIVSYEWICIKFNKISTFDIHALTNVLNQWGTQFWLLAWLISNDMSSYEWICIKFNKISIFDIHALTSVLNQWGKKIPLLAWLISNDMSSFKGWSWVGFGTHYFGVVDCVLNLLLLGIDSTRKNMNANLLLGQMTSWASITYFLGIEQPVLECVQLLDLSP